MKKSLCIVLCFAVVLTLCAVGFSAFAGTDSLSVVSQPNKLYYLSNSDEIDVTGTKLKVKFSSNEQEIELTENIARSGDFDEADPTTTTEAETSAESTTASEKTSDVESTTAKNVAKAAESTEKADASKVKVYYDYPLHTGENKVAFKYDDKIASCTVYVDEDPVKSIAVTKMPTKTSYYYGYDNDTDVELAGLEISVTFKPCGATQEKTYVYKYNDAKSLEFMGHKFEMKFAYQLKVGDNPVIVTYLDKETQFNLEYEAVVVGDVNGDGEVNAADLVRLSRIIINGENLPYNELETDIETDGVINQKDLNRLRDMLTIPEDKGGYDWVFDATLLSYKVSKDGYFYTDSDPWQRNFGYNAFYDYATPYTVMYIDTFRVYFTYGKCDDGTDKEWMLQAWKGQYGMVLYGAEFGVYTKSADRVTPHYDCAADEDLLGMEMVVYFEEKESFKLPYDKYWWITGFKPGALDDYTNQDKICDQLTIKLTVDFPTIEMAKLFVNGLDEKGFEKVGFLDTDNFKKVDTYTIKNNRVEFLWRNIVDASKGTDK